MNGFRARPDGVDRTCSIAPVAVDAVRELYVAHARDIHGYLARHVGGDLADDLLADTFSIAIERWSSYDSSRGGARPWLFGIAANLLRRHWRTHGRRRAALERLQAEPAFADDATSSGDAVARIDAVDDVRLLLDAVADLHSEDYELLVLSAWESLSSAEVAAALDLRPGTVRSRLHRIRRQLDAARRPEPADTIDNKERFA